MDILRWIALLIAVTTGGMLAGNHVGLSQTITSHKDSLGQTHFDGTDRDGNRFSGVTRQDSLGQSHTSIRSGNRTVECVARTNSLGYTRQECH